MTRPRRACATASVCWRGGYCIAAVAAQESARPPRGPPPLAHAVLRATPLPSHTTRAPSSFIAVAQLKGPTSGSFDIRCALYSVTWTVCRGYAAADPGHPCHPTPVRTIDTEPDLSNHVWRTSLRGERVASAAYALLTRATLRRSPTSRPQREWTTVLMRCDSRQSGQPCRLEPQRWVYSSVPSMNNACGGTQQCTNTEAATPSGETTWSTDHERKECQRTVYRVTSAVDGGVGRWWRTPRCMSWKF